MMDRRKLLQELSECYNPSWKNIGPLLVNVGSSLDQYRTGSILHQYWPTFSASREEADGKLVQGNFKRVVQPNCEV
jgi:hypothetical protein